MITVIGIFMIIGGICCICTPNMTYLMTGILLVVFGVLCCFKPLIVTTTVGIFIGLGVISAGANLLTFAANDGK